MIGRTLSHYRIVGQLGAGGMGVVYSAEDDRLGRQVALKFVSSDFTHDEQAIQRLRSEARAASALNHPNICTIYDIGEDDGHPFIVMELMKGQSLRERLNNGALKVPQLVDIGIEVADALHAAHSEGIIHRDIKPGNVFVTERGHVKILDFGLAKLTTTLASNTTAGPAPHTSATGVTHGTPAYMSPEQATGETLDGRSDLFSLGVVLYECATGQHPFPGKTSAVVLAGILDRSPASPLSHNPDLPVRLSEIISNCLEKDRELRYQSAADLRADLKRLRRDLDSGAVRPVERSGAERATRGLETASAASAASVTATVPHHRGAGSGAVGQAEPPVAPQRRFVALLVAGAAALAVLAGAAVVFWPRQSAPPAETAAPALTAQVPPAPVAPTPPNVPPPTVAAPAADPAAASTAPGTEAQMTAAAASFKAGNYRAALASAREVLALDPGHAGAARIRDDSAAMLARFDTAIADARRRIGSGDLEGAARALETARAIDVASPTVVELSARLGDAGRSRGAAERPGARVAPPDAARTPAPPTPAPTAVTPPPQATVPVPPPVVIPSPPPPPEPVTVAPPKVPDPPIRPAVPASREAVERTAPAPAPPPVAKESDDSAIRQVIATYGRAIEGKDISLFRLIKPNLTAQEERRLQDGFRAVASQRVSLTVISIDQKGDTATAVVRRRDDVEAGGRKQTTDARQVLTLSRAAGGWVITEIR